MDFADFAAVVEWVQKYRINGSLVTRGDDGGAYGFGGENSYPQKLTPDCPIIRKNWKLEFADFAYRSGRCSKISLFVEPAQHEAASRLMHERFDGRFEIAASDVDMLDVSPLGINKATGLPSWRRRWGFSVRRSRSLGIMKTICRCSGKFH